MVQQPIDDVGGSFGFRVRAPQVFLSVGDYGVIASLPACTLDQLRRQSDDVLERISNLVRQSGGQPAHCDEFFMTEELDVRDLELVVGAGVRDAEPSLIGKGLNQFDIRFGECAPRASDDSDQAKQTFACADWNDENRTRPVRFLHG